MKGKNRMQEEEQVIAQEFILCNDQEVVVAKGHSGACYVSLPNSCAVLGLNLRGQLQRIQRTEHLSIGLRRLSLLTRGGRQSINCLDIELLGRWLTSLHRRGAQRLEEARREAYFTAVTEGVALLRAAPLQEEEHPSEGTLLAAEISPPTVVEQESQPSLWQETEALQEQRALLATLPGIPGAPILVTTSYQEDQAIREATLARSTDWEEEPLTQHYRYIASNKIEVYFGDPSYPLTPEDMLIWLRELGETTVLTARIVLGLWHIRRADQQLAKDGSAAIRVEDILEWRGVKKHSRSLYVGSEQRRTDGYDWRQKQQVHQDLKLLELCHLRGYHTVIVKGKARPFLINGPYLRLATVQEKEGEVLGYFIAPGAWINTYEEHGNIFLVELDRRIFQLHPHHDQIALRIALYLTEHWRQHWRTGTYTHPIIMQHLLEASMVTIDRANLTSRFVPRVEAALRKLCEQGIVGEARPLHQIEQKNAYWGKEWLATPWSILPPTTLFQRPLLPSAPRSQPFPASPQVPKRASKRGRRGSPLQQQGEEQE